MIEGYIGHKNPGTQEEAISRIGLSLTWVATGRSAHLAVEQSIDK